MSMMDNVRAFQQELEEMGVSPKSVETRIAEAVAAERERCAKELDAKADGWWAVFLKTQDREASKSSYQFRVAAGVIRARAGEKLER